MQRAYAPLLRPFNLTYVQYLALLVLWEAGECSVGDIGRRLFLDSGTLTPVLRRLEALGHITRRRAVHDERSVRIALTERGTALERELDTVRERIFAVTALEDESFAALRRELRDLHSRLNGAGDHRSFPLPSAYGANDAESTNRCKE